MAGRRLVLVALSAALHALALPPWGVNELVWIALVPLFLALRGLRPRNAAGAGLLWGVLAVWAIGYWVPLALAFYWQQPFWFGLLFALGASIVFFGSYIAAFAACAASRPFRTNGGRRAILVAALWVAAEFARARLLTGDPWLLIGYALIPVPVLAQAADLGGVYLLSFVVVAVNAAVAEIAVSLFHANSSSAPFAPGMIGTRRSPRGAMWSAATTAGFLLAALAAYGGLALRRPLPAEPRVALRIVQGNQSVGSQWRPEYYGRGLTEYLRLSIDGFMMPHDAAAPPLIIWPENAIAFFVAHEPTYRATIATVLRPLDADLIVGAPHYQGEADLNQKYFNSAFYVTPDGAIGDRYDKRHLLPFAEYFPLRTIELLRRRFERVRYFTAGGAPTLLRTRIGEVATVICFEGIFPELVRESMARGAVLLVNLSNDAWLGAGAGPEQHLAMVTLRAIENRTWVVRATTTGISAIIDPFGRVTARSATFTAAVLDGVVVPMRVATIYKRFGDVFAYACLLASAAIAIAGGIRSR